MGYNTQSKTYRVFDEKANKLLVTRDVIFDEEGGQSVISCDMENAMVPTITSTGEDVEIDLVGYHATKSVVDFNDGANSNDHVA